MWISMAALVSEADVWTAVTQSAQPSILCPCSADVDECATGNHSCQHGCQDSVGSYFCLCNSGFFLSDDGRGCEGNGHSVLQT